MQCTLVLGILLLLGSAVGADESLQNVSIAYPNDAPPFFFRDELGEPQGVVVDFWKLWAERSGIAVEFVPGTWPETIELLREGKADIHAGLVPTSTRGRFLDFIRPITRTNFAIFYHKSLGRLKTFQEFITLKIGVVEGSYTADYLMSNFPDATFVVYTSIQELNEAAENGEIRVFAGNVEERNWASKKQGTFVNFRMHTEPFFENKPVIAAIREGDHTMAATILRGANLIAPAEIAEIERKWLGKPAGTPERKHALVIAMHQDLPPFSFLNAEGQPTGMFVDIWELWAQKTDQAIEFRLTTWPETLKDLKDGKADIHAGLFLNQERAEWVGFSQPFYEIGASVFFLAKSDAIQSLEQLNGQKVGVVAQTFHEGYLRKTYPGLTLIPFKRTEEMVHAARNGDIRAFLAVPQQTAIILTRLGLFAEFSSIKEHHCSQTFRAGVLLQKPDSLELVDRGFDTISNHELAQIEERWIQNPSNRYYNSKAPLLRFTAQEEAWLRDHPMIRLGASSGTPPLAFLNERGQFAGMLADYVEIVRERTGLNIQTILLPWPEVLQRAQNGDIDVFSGAENDDRRRFADFSSPYLSMPYVAINRIETPFLSNIGNLQGTKVAVVKNLGIHRKLLQDYPEFEFVPSRDDLEALQSVATGRADAYVGSLLVANHLIQQQKLTNLKVAAPAGYPDKQIRYGIRKDWPELLSILNKTIASVTPEEHDAISRRWVSLRYDQTIDWQRLRRWGAGIVLVFGGVLALTLFWNRRLSLEVYERQQAEEETERLRSLLGSIIDSMPSALVGVERDGRVMQWNREAENMTGTSAANARGKMLTEVFPQLEPDMEKVWQAIEHRKIQKSDKRRRNEAEGPHYSEVTVYPLLEHETEGAVIRVDDVTARVRLEEMMIQTEKMMSVGGLAAGMAHEINNPLGIIIQALQDTIRRLSPEVKANQRVAEELELDLESLQRYLEQRNILKYFEGMREAGLRASKIVSNMLNFSYRNNSEMQLADMNQLIDATLEIAANDYDLKKKYDFRNIEVIKHYDPELPAVRCMPNEIQQVFFNLLRNAAQAVAEKLSGKAVQPQVKIVTCQEDNFVKIVVEDNGPGISEKHQKHVFEPFYTTKPVNVGTGLGLSVSYFIVTTHHKGSISVDSTPGQGTRFNMLLPL